MAGISNPCRWELLTTAVYSIGGGFGTGLWIDRYTFSGDFDQVITDLYKAIEGGEFDD